MAESNTKIGIHSGRGKMALRTYESAIQQELQNDKTELISVFADKNLRIFSCCSHRKPKCNRQSDN